MRTRTIRVVAVAAFAGLLIAAIPGAVGASSVRPSGVVFTDWGWVTVRNTHTGTYTPATTDRGNSAGKVNVVKQPFAGQYTIIFKGLRTDGGVPQVSSLGASPRACMVSGWGSGTGTNEEVYVNCYTPLGVPVSSRFSVSFLATGVEVGSLAYLFGSGVTEDANSQYSFNSTGGLNHIDRTGVGHYIVTLGGLGAARGNVQVSARLTLFAAARTRPASVNPAGVNPAGVNPVTCNAVGWHPAISDQRVEIQCRESHGSPTDTSFMLTFTDQAGLKGQGAGKVAYLWANKAGASSYTPSASYRYSSAGTVAHITRQSTGRYVVSIPGMPKGGAAVVNAYGSAATRCQLGAIRTDGSPQRIRVLCFDFSGSPADTKFSLSYER